MNQNNNNQKRQTGISSKKSYGFSHGVKKINLTEYIRKSAVQVSLSESERERMKRVLSEYVAMKPMRYAPLDRRAPLSYMFMSIYAFSRKSVAALLVIGILFSGAGISFAAENALPGDALYPVKVEVNEPVVAALSVSSEAKVLWNAERAERRLEETAKLASSNRLTEKAEEELTMRFERHAESVVKDVERLEEDDSSSAVDIASRFENRLLAHEVVLEDAWQDDRARAFKSRVQAKADRLSRIRGRILPPVSVSAVVAVADTANAPALFSAESTSISEPDVSSTFAMKSSIVPEVVSAPDVREEEHWVSDGGIRRVARNAVREVEHVEAILKKIEERIDTETRARVSSEIVVARAFLSDGDTFTKLGDSPSAFESYRQSIAVSAKLSVILKAFQKERLRLIPQSFVQINAGFDERPDSDDEIVNHAPSDTKGSNSDNESGNEPSDDSD